MRTRAVEVRDGVNTFPDADEGAIDCSIQIEEFDEEKGRRVLVDAPSLTRQSEKDAADINIIMRNYVQTGSITVQERQAMFADVSEMGDYRDALHFLQTTDEAFMSLRAEDRARFDNDPAKFLEFYDDPANEAECIKLGWKKGPEVEVPVVVPKEVPAK